MLPPLIHRRALQASLGVSSETMRQWLDDGRLPAFDVDLSDRLQGWYPQSLRAAGVNVPDAPPPGRLERLAAPAVQRAEVEIPLASAEQIASASARFEVCGVYFLLLDGAVVYVGQSCSILRRLGEHVPSKVFDAYAVIECAPEDLNRLESRYIDALQPPLNATLFSNQTPRGVALRALKMVRP